MSEGGAIIRVDMVAGGWAAVPRAALDNEELSLAARGLLAWFLTRADGFEVRVSACRAKFRMGKQAWSTLAGELATAGHYHRSTARDTSGRVRTVVSITALPRLPVPVTEGGKPALGTGVGLTDSRSSRRPVEPKAGWAGKTQEKREKEKKEPPPHLLHEESCGGAIFFQGGEAPGVLLQILGSAGVCAERRQVLLDELDGACAAAVSAGKPVRSPAAYLRRLAALDAGGGFAAEHADRVAQGRRDRAAAERLVERQHAARLAPPKKENAPAPEKPSQARLSALKTLKALRAEMRST